MFITKTNTLAMTFLTIFFVVVIYLFSSNIFAYDENPPQTSSSPTAQELVDKRNRLEQALQEARKGAVSTQTQISMYAEKVYIVQQQIDRTSEQIYNLNEQIKFREKQISNLQSEVNHNINLLKKIIRVVYMSGEEHDIETIMNSQGFDDFLSRVDLVRRARNYYRGITDGITSKMDTIRDDKLSLEKMKQDMVKTRETFNNQQADLTTTLAQQQQLLSSYSGQTTLYLDAIDQNNTQLKSVDDELAQYYINQNVVNLPNSGNDGSSERTITPGKGMFAWPVPGFDYISSYWGDGRGHKGIDIAGAGIYAAEIIAAADGKVIKANKSGYGGGYGLFVVIDHGSSFATLYGHMSRVNVDEGQEVKKGEVIGNVGSTGDSTGPHLHFEVRVNSEQKNPLDYF